MDVDPLAWAWPGAEEEPVDSPWWPFWRPFAVHLRQRADRARTPAARHQLAIEARVALSLHRLLYAAGRPPPASHPEGRALLYLPHLIAGTSPPTRERTRAALRVPQAWLAGAPPTPTERLQLDAALYGPHLVRQLTAWGRQAQRAGGALDGALQPVEDGLALLFALWTSPWTRPGVDRATSVQRVLAGRAPPPDGLPVAGLPVAVALADAGADSAKALLAGVERWDLTHAAGTSIAEATSRDLTLALIECAALATPMRIDRVRA